MTKEQSNYIKLIAVITMFIDHVGLILFPNTIVLRIIGRIAFPLFAFQIGVGYRNTGDFRKYVMRLFLFGTAVQVGLGLFDLLTDISFSSACLNIFFTLSLGLTAIHLYETRKYHYLIAEIVFAFLFEVWVIHYDYGLYGVLIILMLYIAKEEAIQMLEYIFVLAIYYFWRTGEIFQLYAILALFFLMRPFSLKIKIPKYAFYLFYPLHLIILRVIYLLKC